jgi:hypothetical protein
MDTAYDTSKADPQSIKRCRSSTFQLDAVLTLHYNVYGVCRNSLRGHTENVRCSCKKKRVVFPRVYTRAFYN